MLKIYLKKVSYFFNCYTVFQCVEDHNLSCSDTRLPFSLALRATTAAALQPQAPPPAPAREASGTQPRPGPAAAVQSVRCYSRGSHETEEEFDARWVTYFNKPDIDAWELRKGMNTLVGYDLVPEPKIIDAALPAVRILEVVKDKAGPRKEIYPYVIQELRPTLNELGISTPEELDLDKV
uniref:Cytochrome c oxidase subunit 5A, mitochondrial n=1 Tax=Canis lupus familiaris TaxID=9615 RepID=A0A8I3PI57_CANLF